MGIIQDIGLFGDLYSFPGHLWQWLLGFTPVIGLFGDLLTFSGGLLLAVDVAQKERDFAQIKNIASAVKDPWMARIKVEMEGVILADDKDVERAFIHRSARKAVWGCVFLSCGFLFLLSVRVLEFWK